MDTRFDWTWQGVPVPLHYEVTGMGRDVLLLPAFSTISTRAEMAPLAALLTDFRCTCADWPGFGGGRQPKLFHEPALQLAYLEAFVQQICGAGVAVIAAGHAAGYVLTLARQRPGIWSRIVLIAPTWRGPLPTMMNGYRPIQRTVHAALRRPILGRALYRLNVTKPVIGLMSRRHVYVRPEHLSDSFMRRKADVARQPGRRFGSGAFVTGGLDPVHDRKAFAALASPPTAPTLVLYGPQTPPKSRAEIQALTALPGIESCLMAAGSLGLHEDCADEIAPRVRAFLS